MMPVKPLFSSFEAYLSYSNEMQLEGRYELIAGALVELPPESPENDFMVQELFWLLAIAKVVPRELIRPHTCEVQVPILQAKDAANRYPDLVILSPEHLELMGKRLTITREMPPPRLVAEVLSPGKTNRERDLIHKRSQYAAISVPEYWLIDPLNQTITVLSLGREGYWEVGIFSGEERIVSPELGELELTAAQVFRARA